jgi:hypothetical protein
VKNLTNFLQSKKQKDLRPNIAIPGIGDAYGIVQYFFPTHVQM